MTTFAHEDEICADFEVSDKKLIEMKSSKLSRRYFGKKRILLISMACAVGAVIHFVFQLQYYLTYPTSIEEVSAGLPFQFPDVTICPLSSLSQLRQKEINKPIYSNLTFIDILQRMRLVWRKLIEEDKDQNNNSFEIDSKQIARWSILPFLKLSKLRHQANDMIFECIYLKRKCSFLNFTEIFHPHFHRCFLFRPNTRQFSSTDDENALSLLIYAGDNNKTMISGNDHEDFQRGIYVLINSPSTGLDSRGSKSLVSVGTSTFLSLKMKVFRRHNFTRRACESHTTYVRHWDWDAENVKTFFNYTRQNCISEKMQEIFHERCKCIDEKKMFPAKYKNISTGCYHVPKELLPFISTDANFSSDAILNRTMKGLLQNLSCIAKEHKFVNNRFKHFRAKCRSLCNQIDYEITRNENLWPADIKVIQKQVYYRLKRSIDKVVRLSKRNKIDSIVASHLLNQVYRRRGENITKYFLKLHIGPSTLTGQLRDEQRSYPFQSFLSDVGGSLGLWIGVSVLGMVKTVDNLFQLIITAYYKRNQKNKRSCT